MFPKNWMKLLVISIVFVMVFGALPAVAQGPVEESVDAPDVELDENLDEQVDDQTGPVEEAEAPPVVELTDDPIQGQEESSGPVEMTIEAPDVELEGAPVEVVPETELEVSADLSAQDAYQSTTMFAIQNPSTTADTTADINIYDTAGASVYNDSQTVAAGYAYLLDQAAQTLANFTQGSAVISGGEQVGVTTLIKETASASTPRYDTYNGLTTADAATTVTVPQFMRGVSSLNNVYETLLAIQNTGAAEASVDVLFQAIYMGTTATRQYTIPANASVYIRSQDVTELGTSFFGFAIVSPTTGTTAQLVVAQATIGSGEAGSTSGGLFAFKGFAGPITTTSGEVFGGQLYKGISSAGCDWNSALSIANTGDVAAAVTVKYYPSAGIPAQFAGGDPFSYSRTIPAQATDAAASYISLDQRYDANIATSTYYGTVSLEVTTGEIVAISNVRAAPCDPATTQFNNSVPVESGSSAKILAPMIFKYDQAASSISTSFSWSSAIGVQNLSTNPTDISVTYYPYDGSAETTYNSAIPGSSSLNIDQRYDTNFAADTFAGAVMIESLTAGQNIRGAVNIRGNDGPSSDAFAGYLLIPAP